jgi:hypothetical protein
MKHRVQCRQNITVNHTSQLGAFAIFPNQSYQIEVQGFGRNQMA